MPEKVWNTKRQMGELIGELRGLRTGQKVHLPGNISVGVVAMGRGAGSRERRFAVVNGHQREYYRSATEAAVNSVNLSKRAEATAAQVD